MESLGFVGACLRAPAYQVGGNRLASTGGDLVGEKTVFLLSSGISVEEIAILFLQVRFGCPNVEADAKTRLIPHVDIAVLDNRIG